MTETRQAPKRRPKKGEDTAGPRCHCGSDKTFVYKTLRYSAYWKCRDCGDTGIVSLSARGAVAVDDIQER